MATKWKTGRMSKVAIYEDLILQALAQTPEAATKIVAGMNAQEADKPVDDALDVVQREYACLQNRVLFVFQSVFGSRNWEWSDCETALDLFRAEISTLEREKENLREASADIRDRIASSAADNLRALAAAIVGS